MRTNLAVKPKPIPEPWSAPGPAPAVLQPWAMRAAGAVLAALLVGLVPVTGAQAADRSFGAVGRAQGNLSPDAQSLTNLRNRLNMVPPSPASSSSWLSLSLPGGSEAASIQRSWESAMGLSARALGEVAQADRARRAGDLAGYQTHFERALSLEQDGLFQFRSGSSRDWSLLNDQYQRLKGLKDGSTFVGDFTANFGGPGVKAGWEAVKNAADIIEQSGARGFDLLTPSTWKPAPLVGGGWDVATHKATEDFVGNVVDRFVHVPALGGRPVTLGDTFLNEPLRRVGQSLGLAGMDSVKSNLASKALDFGRHSLPTGPIMQNQAGFPSSSLRGLSPSGFGRR